MNLNEKVEELIKITAALKQEINELKGRDTNTRLNELEQEKEALKEDISDLRQTLMQQNEKILTLLKKQNVKLVETIETEKLAPQLVFSRKISQYSKLFPIKSIKELDELEALITDNNVNELIAVVHQLLGPHGIIKNIVALISEDCIMDCNLDGIHNKRRLLNSPKFMDLIFQATYYEGYSKQLFLEQMRRSIRMVKNRHNKNLCRSRQAQRRKQNETESLLQESSTDGMENLTDGYVKQEVDEEFYSD